MLNMIYLDKYKVAFIIFWSESLLFFKKTIKVQLNLWSCIYYKQNVIYEYFSFLVTLIIFTQCLLYDRHFYKPSAFLHVLTHVNPQQPLEENTTIIFIAQMKKKKKKTDAKEIQVICSELHR